MTTAATEEPQTSFEERAMIDRELESAITFFLEAQESVADAREGFRNAEKVLQGDVGKREMSAGKYRVGKYILTVSDVAAHQRIRVALAKSAKSKK
jgi:hypothetical protein